jgi:antitoxin YefM
MAAMSASQARRELFPLIQRVSDNHEAVEITSKHGNAVLMSAEDFASWQETAYLLRSPANAERLGLALEAARAGNLETHDLDRA